MLVFPWPFNYWMLKSWLLLQNGSDTRTAIWGSDFSSKSVRSSNSTDFEVWRTVFTSTLYHLRMEKLTIRPQLCKHTSRQTACTPHILRTTVHGHSSRKWCCLWTFADVSSALIHAILLPIPHLISLFLNTLNNSLQTNEREALPLHLKGARPVRLKVPNLQGSKSWHFRFCELGLHCYFNIRKDSTKRTHQHIYLQKEHTIQEKHEKLKKLKKPKGSSFCLCFMFETKVTCGLPMRFGTTPMALPRWGKTHGTFRNPLLLFCSCKHMKGHH